MVEGFVAAVFAGLLWVFGMWIGVHGADDSWQNDCKTVGMHREGESVYKCEKVK